MSADIALGFGIGILCVVGAYATYTFLIDVVIETLKRREINRFMREQEISILQCKVADLKYDHVCLKSRIEKLEKEMKKE
jgi:hypothetical protein